MDADDFDLRRLDSELWDLAPGPLLRRLASNGVRGEIFFPVPYLLEKNPLLTGYYRLLLGFSQKGFYEQGPFSAFKITETSGKLPQGLIGLLRPFAISLIASVGLLLDGVDPVGLDMVHELQMLTLGPQLRGSRNVDIGQAAVQAVFDLLKGLLAPYSPEVKRRGLVFSNDSSLTIAIHFGGDPDIGITMKLGAEDRKLVAIEIKGGTDSSNIWNRLGEAEKSHQTARKRGFNELWTVTAVDVQSSMEAHAMAMQKSPSTTRFFFLPRIVDSANPEGILFRQLLGSIVGARIGAG